MMIFDPLSPEFRANPYPYYDMLRIAAPIFYMGNMNMWFCTRHEDCTNLLRDSRLGHEILHVMTREELNWGAEENAPEHHRRLNRMQSRWILFRDPPDHTRLRGLVHKAFTPRMIEKLRGHIETITNDLLDQVQDAGQMDIINDLATPLPVMVIAHMLGVPLQDQEMFRGWSRDLAGTLELMVNDQHTWDRAAYAAMEFEAYFKDLAKQRRKNPQDDLLSALVQAEENGDKLNEDELIATCILLLIAGHETTVNLIGNGAFTLLSNPDQWEKLKSELPTNPGMVKNAVEELLRYDSPVQMTSRWIMEDFELSGNHFKKGQQIAVMFGAANRDPEQFENPNTLDITRENIKHLSFGNGIHFCLGSPLARMEGQIAFKTLAERLPNLQLETNTPPYRETYVLRGLKALPVRF